MDSRRLVYGSIFCLICIVVWSDGEQTECTEGQSSYIHTTRYYVTVRRSTIVWSIVPSWSSTWLKYKIQYYQSQEMKEGNRNKCCPGYRMGENETCVVECQTGKYGENCTLNCTCPENAFDSCDIETGNCTCKQGWTGTNCTEQCAEGYYGQNCEEQCHCQNNSTCNIYTGHCNCSSPGWHGFLCEKECGDDKFGMNCLENCTCHVNQSCNRIDGNCTCKPGRTGTDCQDECSEGFFGKDCISNCTCNMTNTINCNVTSGECECKAGYSGRNCNYVCPPGTYGKDCALSCSDICNYTQYCLPLTGECICIGKTGVNCTEDCDEGKFGIDCSDSCTCTEFEICNPIFGNCSCKPDQHGQECPNVTDKDQKQNPTISWKNTDSTDAKDSTGNLPIIISAGVVGAVVLGVVVVLVWRFKRNRTRQDSEKRDITRSSGSNGENQSPRGVLELQRVNGTDYSYASTSNVQRRGEDKNDLYEETDGNDGEKDLGHEIDFHENENTYDETNTKPTSINQAPNEYNTCRDVKQNLASSNEDNEYNVLHEINKPKHVSQEGYWTFQQVKKLELDDSEQDTYNVLNGEEKSDPGQFQTYGYASAKDCKKSSKDDENESFDSIIAQSTDVNDCAHEQTSGNEDMNKDYLDENVSEDNVVDDSEAPQLYENVQTGTGENGDPSESIYEYSSSGEKLS